MREIRVEDKLIKTGLTESSTKLATNEAMKLQLAIREVRRHEMD